MPDLTKARRALLETGETPHLTSAPRRARAEDDYLFQPDDASYSDWPKDENGNPKWIPLGSTAEPKKKPIGPKWKAVWLTEAAVVLLLVSMIFGMKVLPWLIDLSSR